MAKMAHPRRLMIVAVLFALVIIIGLITVKKPVHSYKMNSSEMLTLLGQEEYKVAPEKALEIIDQNTSGYQFVDLRDQASYAKGHLKDAINIPVHSLLNADYAKLFKDSSTTYILYGANQSSANGPWMILKQLGYPSVQILQGGYDYLTKMATTDSLPVYDAEVAAYDYAAVFAETIEKAQKEEEVLKAKPKPVYVTKPAPKKIIPKPKVIEEEEEEGC